MHGRMHGLMDGWIASTNQTDRYIDESTSVANFAPGPHAGVSENASDFRF